MDTQDTPERTLEERVATLEWDLRTATFVLKEMSEILASVTKTVRQMVEREVRASA